MDGCNEFRRPETYKNNPLEQILLKIWFWRKFVDLATKIKKIHSTAFFFVEFWVIKWYGVTVDEIALTKKFWIEKIILEQKKFFLNTPKLEKKKFFGNNIFSGDCRWHKVAKNNKK